MKQKREKVMDVEFPVNEAFTIKQMQEAYPTVKNITLRYKLAKAIERNQIQYIGKNNTTMGRPTIVLASCPLTKEVLLTAQSNGVVLDESVNKLLIDVATVEVKTTEQVTV